MSEKMIFLVMLHYSAISGRPITTASTRAVCLQAEDKGAWGLLWFRTCACPQARPLK